MYQLMIMDRENQIVSVCANERKLPDVKEIYPKEDYIGIEVPYNEDLIDNFQLYYYDKGKFIKKDFLDYQITRTYITPGEATTIMVPPNTTAVIGDLEYEVEDGIIEYQNPNIGINTLILRSPRHLDTIVEIEVLEE